ncbi:MAG: zinc ribbon domain-containing protein [Bacteroides sp.]|nr:zinc ribbon domain-containing protein [[Eubacterium] siraeum]MCM1454936.1 zinc ribbon domain-containing protein [Bacteroides sp.]
MKYCQRCGAQVDDEAVVCTKCGCQIETVKQGPSGLAIAAFVFSLLGGWIGLVLDIIGLCTLKTEADRKYCKVGLIISICWIVLEIILIVVVVTSAASLAAGIAGQLCFI